MQIKKQVLMKTFLDSYQKGIKEYNLGGYKEAIGHFDKEIENNPGYSRAFHMRGFAKYMTADKEGAFMDWLKAAELGEKGIYELINRHFR